MTEEGKPGGTSRFCVRPEMDSENPADDILVDADAEGPRDLLGATRAAPSAIASFHFNDRVDQLLVGPLGPGRPTVGVKRAVGTFA